ncbi:MAG: hypothetical protein P4K93_04255 [Terracidiphilus sp.]|nr:hypothetical protein [Terracidiphilus sp.]MDR3797335.1 hypothetical protein [Terracidiphilus sp.]
MNTNPHNAMNSDSGPDCGEATLRLIAGLPAPAGLEERVHKALGAAPHELRGGRVLAWPARFRARAVLESNWMRATAAAAIVFVVVGGGWGVYSRVQPGPAGKVIVMPQPMPSSGGFSGAGAIRTPATIPGPKVREQGTKGPRDQEAQTAKKPATPKKSATGQHPASAPTPQPAVSQ